jgi:GTP 3',8-cyclase
MATLRAKLGLLRGLLAADGTAFTGPFFVTLDLTRRCNLRCVCCRYHSSLVHLPSPGDQEVLDLPVPVAERLLVELAELGTGGIFFIGEGEPLLHPAALDLMGRAKRASFHVSVSTNGTRIDRACSRTMVEIGADEVLVSLWGSTREDFTLHQFGGSSELFDQAVEGLKVLREIKEERGTRKPRVVLHQPLTRINLEKPLELVALARQCGCDAVSVGPLREHRGGLSSMALLEEQEEQVAGRLRVLARELDRAGITHNVKLAITHYRVGEMSYRSLPCYVLWFHARIKVDGTVLPCNPCDVVMGNLHESSFAEIWNGPRFRRFRRQVGTREGLASMGGDCDCGFCCHLSQNLDVHHRARWLVPAARLVHHARSALG